MRIHTDPDPAFKSGSTTVKINRDLIKPLKLRKQIHRNIEVDLSCSIENQYLGCVESSDDVNTGLLSSRSSLHMVFGYRYRPQCTYSFRCAVLRNPDTGSGVFLNPGSGIPDREKVRIWIRDEQPGSYFIERRNRFLGKILKFFDADPGYGMETIRIRDGTIRIRDGKSRIRDPKSGINIPDPQHRADVSE